MKKYSITDAEVKFFSKKRSYYWYRKAELTVLNKVKLQYHYNQLDLLIDHYADMCWVIYILIINYHHCTKARNNLPIMSNTTIIIEPAF